MTRRDLFAALPALAALPAVPARAAAAKPRLRSAICAYSMREALKAGAFKYEDLVRMAVDNNVEGLDLTVYWFPNTENSFLLPLKRFAYRSGVDIYSISVRTNMCQPTPDLRAKELAEVKKWVDVAERLGAVHIRVFGGNVPKTSTVEEASGWVTEILKRASEYAGAKGIILGLENHGGITERADTIVKIVKAVDSPWVGINLDTGNFNREVFPQTETCIPHAVAVQVKVEMRTDDGKRIDSDWDRFAKMLVTGGYQGYLALEYEAKEDPMTAMPKYLKKLNDVIARANKA